jgi:hypothetical protein
VTLASLRTRYPEFENAPDATVQAAIDDAEGIYSEGNCGTLYDQIVLEAACQMLAQSAYGREMKIDGERGLVTKHDAPLRRLTRKAGAIPAGIALDD